MTVYGIDLGTTYSLIGYYDGDKYTLIPDSEGKKLIKSQISIEENEIIVGNKCKYNIIKNTKSFVGKKWEESCFLENCNLVECEITDSVLINKQGYSFKATDISRMIISHLVSNSKELGYNVEKIVITVPSYYTSFQRNLIKNECELLSLTVCNIINEPTSAALYLGQDYENLSNLLVLDIGGSTTDITILDVDDSDFMIKSSKGNLNLGGINIDKNIKDYYNLDTEIEAETLKLSGKISDSDWDILTQDFYKKILLLVSDSLSSINMYKESLSNVMVIGGSSRLYKLKDSLKTLFPERIINISEFPDKCVVLGACYKGYLIEQNDCNLPCLFDILPLSIGIQLNDNMFSPILKQNDRKPISKKKEYSLHRDYQDRIILKVFEGERILCKDNFYLGEYCIEIPPRYQKMDVTIQVTFNIDLSGILTLGCLIEGYDGYRKEEVIECNIDTTKSIHKKTASVINPEDIEKDDLIREYLELKKSIEEDLIPEIELDNITQEDINVLKELINFNSPLK